MPAETLYSLADISRQASFVYNITKSSFEYLSPELSLLIGVNTNDVPVQFPDDLIFDEDRDYLSDQYKNLLSGAFRSTADIRLKIEGEEAYFRIAPFIINNEVIVGKVEEVTSEINNILTVQKYANKKKLCAEHAFA